jgi:outer membrane protein
MARITASFVSKTLAAGILAAANLPAFAHETGDIILRMGPVTVAPNASSSLVTTAAIGALAGTSVGVGNDTQLGLNPVYMYTDSLAFEVLAATPFENDLSVTGLAQYGFATTDLGSTKHLPPTVSALYFFGDLGSAPCGLILALA